MSIDPVEQSLSVYLNGLDREEALAGAHEAAAMERAAERIDGLEGFSLEDGAEVELTTDGTGAYVAVRVLVSLEDIMPCRRKTALIRPTHHRIQSQS